MKSRSKYTDQQCLDQAKLFTRKGDWAQAPGSLYQAAKSKHIMEQCTEHMKNSNKWTKETLMASARQYESKSQWRKGCPGGVEVALMNGWFEECTAHMPERAKNKPRTKKNKKRGA